MVTCSQCKTQNRPERDFCQKCQADLLPRPSTSRRAWAILRAILVGLIIVAIGLGPLIAWGREDNMATYYDLSLLIILVGLVMLIRGVVQAAGPAPLYKRYLERAARHARIDPGQAAADFVHGVMLAPAELRPALTQEIPKNLKEIIDQSGNSLAAATSGYQSPEGVRKIVYSVYTTWAGLAEDSPGSRRSAGVRRASSSRRRKEILARLGKMLADLAGNGLVLELGYCPRCKAVVSCDAGGHCSCDEKHGGARGVVYVVPEEVELFKKRLRQVYGTS